MIPALVTRWNRLGRAGLVGPERCSIKVEIAIGKLAIRLEKGGEHLAIFLEPKDARDLIREIFGALRKIVASNMN